MKQRKGKGRGLRRLSVSAVVAFRIVNRRGYATICRNHLTEGVSLPRAYARLVKACRRRGYELPEGRVPRLRNV